MNTSSAPQSTTPPRRRGPKPQGFIHCNVTLAPDLVEWAKEQPGGLSGLLRKLLDEERRRRTPTPA